MAGEVIGLGGLFFLCDDVDATRAWYRDTLGMTLNDYGGFEFLHADSATAFPKGARTIFSPFKAGSDYFAPSKAPYMINLMVDDLDAVVARAEAAGAQQTQPQEDHAYGRFAWLMDPDGRKVELWQPIED